MSNRYHIHVDGENIAIFLDKGKGYRNPLVETITNPHTFDALVFWASKGSDMPERSARVHALCAAMETLARANARVQA
jgi:hypothetical protein